MNSRSQYSRECLFLVPASPTVSLESCGPEPEERLRPPGSCGRSTLPFLIHRALFRSLFQWRGSVTQRWHPGTPIRPGSHGPKRPKGWSTSPRLVQGEGCIREAYPPGHSRAERGYGVAPAASDEVVVNLLTGARSCGGPFSPSTSHRPGSFSLPSDSLRVSGRVLGKASGCPSIDESGPSHAGSGVEVARCFLGFGPRTAAYRS